MSLKSIELQLSVPKTQEVSNHQNNIYHRTAVEQGQLMAKTRSQEIRNRKKAEKLRKSKLNEENTTRTPRKNDTLKGKFIDLEL